MYLYLERLDRVYFIFAYPKNVQGSLMEAQKKRVRKLVSSLQQESGV